MTSEWIFVEVEEPPEGMVVMTKIDDADGVRNVQALKRIGRLYVFPDGSMYVHYLPTHWRQANVEIIGIKPAVSEQPIYKYS